MLNGYKISAKEHQEIDSWAADEISVSKMLFSKYLEYVPLILWNYEKLKRKKIVKFKISSIFKCAINLSDNFRIICRNKSHGLSNKTFLHKFYIELDREYKKLVLTENVTNDYYVEKDCLKKKENVPLI